MKWRRDSYCVIIIFIFGVSLKAQLSPGDLSQAHAELEGMSNCTQCHILGKKVSNQKCLECHAEIQSLLNAGRGYHASKNVVERDCFECHSDHHGRKFDMVRFDEESFNHDETGYQLTGQHAAIDCRECHQSENISNPEIRNRKTTFLGLQAACLSCHADFHQKTLSSDCTSCHNFESFRPATGFDHDNAKFKLAGKHVEVDCKACHIETTKNGRSFQQFTGLDFGDCTDCHKDPHLGHFNNKCSECHSEQSFELTGGGRRFNHNRTSFSLKGAHQSVACFTCHVQDRNPVSVFQDKLGIGESDCISCHTDVHEGKFGNDCAQCHSEVSFLALKDMDFFDHSVTDFPLEGMHAGVDCKSCHSERYTDAIDFSECKNCHEDYHMGEFSNLIPVPDCKDCHSLDYAFDYTLYGLDEHADTKFPLEGAHLATPCFMCHVSEEQWTFRNIGETCVDCHDDIHKGYIDSTYYPEQQCNSCHRSDQWSNVNFDHSRTGWPLDGEHSGVDCRSCHFEDSRTSGNLVQTFNTLSGKCVQCHDNVHGEQFAIDGETECTSCHITSSWFPQNFDHSQTAFVLEGKHAEIDCNACHIPGYVDGKEIIDYQIESFECIDCHQ